MNRNWKKVTGRRGFTFAELLIVIAIVAALVAIGFAGAAEIQRNMKQTRLDRMAENLYSAAQNQLKLRAASGVVPGGTELSEAPADMTDKELNYCYPADTQATAHHLRYVVSPNTMLFPDGSIAPELQTGKWIVELEPRSYTVYSVFYFDPEAEQAAVLELIANYNSYNTNGGAFGNTLEKLRGEPKERRAASGGVVGYFSGNIADLAERKTGELKCMLELKNGEELKALVTVELPQLSDSQWQDSDYTGETLTLVLKVTGQTSGAEKRVELPSHTLTALELSGSASYDPARRVKTVKFGVAGGAETLLVADDKLFFDSLKTGKGFGDLFKTDDQDPAKKFIPGEDVRVEATVSCGNEKIVLYPASDVKSANSLFDNGSGSGAATIGGNSFTPVYVKYGRHLQNLGAASGFDGYTGKTVAAMQTAGIDFGNGSPWQTAYGEAMKFKPLADPKIAGYYGNNYEIHELSTGSVDGNAGVFASFSGGELKNIRLVDCSFAGTGSVGGLVGAAAGTLTVSNCETKGCTVAGAEASKAGGMVGMASAELTMIGCEANNCTVAGGSAAGGLIGTAVGAAELKNCKVYMETLRCGENETARDVDWVTASAAGSAAGGLIGSASGALTVDKSFAATVVKGKNHAGGLVGSAGGALTVTGSYADCYLNALYVGGLAGFCGSGSSFTTCYSAGFVMDGFATPVSYAAGFVPSKADVRNSYTVFCFDDATRLAVSGSDAPMPAAAANIYALANGGARQNAYHNCQMDAKDATGEYKTAEEMETLKASDLGVGFRYASPADPAATTLYRMTAAGITLMEPYSYPTVPGLPHYNDYFATTPADPVELWAVVLKGTKDDPAVTAESAAYGKSKLVGDFVPATFAQRGARKQVFVGWFDEETIFDGSGDARTLKTAMLKGWYAQLDKLNIRSGALLNVPAELGAREINGGRVAASDNVKETKRLYAVYREVLPFDVTIKFVNYDVNLFKGDAFTEQQIRAQYLEGSSISQDIYFTVDPLQYESFDRSGTSAASRTFAINTEKLTNKGYGIIDANYDLRSAYPADEYPNPPYSDLDAKYLHMRCFTFDGQNSMLDADAQSAVYSSVNENSATLTVKINEKRVCSILCSSAQYEVPLRFAFLDAQANTFEAAKTTAFRSVDYPDYAAEVAERIKDVEYVEPEDKGTEDLTETEKAGLNGKDFWISPDGSYCLIKEGTAVVRHSIYTVVVNMKLPPNMVVWKQIPEFDGFKLLKNDIQHQRIVPLEEGVRDYPFDTSPIIPFERTYFELAFDLYGGVHYISETEYFNTIESNHHMRYRQDTAPQLPVSLEGKNVAANADAVTEHGWLSRPGHVLTGWEFYDLKTYSTDSKEPLGMVELYSSRDDDGSASNFGTIKSVTLYEYEKDENGETVKDAEGNPVLKESTTSDSYLMPAHDVMAKARWEDQKYAPVRVEIYVQNVTDDWGLNQGEVGKTAPYTQDTTYQSSTEARTYGLYNAYTVGTKNRSVDVDAYRGKTDPDMLLNLAYINGNKTTEADIKASDLREYLSITDGTVKSKQLIFNSKKTYGDGTDIRPEFDAFGNAVFRVYYDRALNRFDFSSTSWVDRFPKQNVSDPGDYGSYQMKQVWQNNAWLGGNQKWYASKRFFGWTSLSYSRKVYLPNDDSLIDKAFSEDPTDIAAVNNTANYREAQESDLIKIGGNYYIFAKLVKNSGDNYYYIPFYNKSELTKAKGYSWSLSPEGLYAPREGLNETHYGLFEQPFTDWAWPGGGSFAWTVYACGTFGANPQRLDNTTLSYLNSFYYDNWMSSGSYSGYPELYFSGTQISNAQRKVRFYLETDGERGGTISFRDLPEYTWYTETDLNHNFTLNEKFNGYKIYGYRADESSDGITRVNGSYPTVAYGEILDIYYMRNEYKVYFKNARFGSTDHAELSRYYGQTVERLPVVTEANAPEDIGQYGYIFGGWYTGSNGTGNKLVICEDDGSGAYVPVENPETETSGGVTWQKGVVCERVKKPGTVDEYTYHPYVMSSGNRMAFAYWAKQDATVRLFYLFQDQPDPTAADATIKAQLFEMIPELDPADASSIEQAWAADENIAYDPATKTYTAGAGVKYHFDGWYQYPDQTGMPRTDTVLSTRFHEKELVGKDTMTLAAQWSQNAGKADYTIVCNLCDENGGIVKTLNVVVPGGATIGEALNVYAPTATEYPAYANDLNGYYALTSIQSIERFRLGDSVIFYYAPAECWYYKTTYWADFGGVKVAIYSDLDASGKPTRKTSAENVYVIANDPYQCYTLDASATNPAELKKPTDFDQRDNEYWLDHPVSAAFTYRLDASAITSPAALNWVRGGEAPQLVSIRGGGTLACFTEGYHFETYYSNGANTETDLADLLDSLPLGTSTVTTAIVLETDGGAVVKEIYRAATDVKVYREADLGSLGTFYDDGKAFYSKEADGTMTKTAYARIKLDDFGTLYYDGSVFLNNGTTKLADVLAAAEAKAAELGKTFKGFFLNLGDTAPVIDENGNAVGAVTGEVDLKAKYE